MVYKWLINSLNKISGHSCFLCDEAFSPLNSTQICGPCLRDLPRFNQVCQQCGLSISGDFNKCGHCLTQPPSYDRVLAPFAYAEPIRQLIANFKYQRQLAIGSIFTEQLVSQLIETPVKVKAILPVPLHPGRLRHRGFNQALELARPIARKLNLPLLIKEVQRHKNTEEQSSLSGRQRRVNLKNAFTLVNNIAYESVAIVDDVMTTGSTVEELSKLLKKNGVKYVEVWCIARAGHVQ